MEFPIGTSPTCSYLRIKTLRIPLSFNLLQIF
jgi:hypothetical protein